jgi:phosphoglycolate phosphatase
MTERGRTERGRTGLAPPAPSVLVWDWDNTLIDGWAAISHALNAVFAAHAMPLWTIETTKANVRGSLRDTFPAMFGAAWTEARDLFYATLRIEHLAHLQPMTGAEAALAAGATWPQAVVSNKSGDFLRAEVAHLGWAGRFRAVVGAGDASADKPAAAPIHLALNAIHPADSTVWYIGDTALDMQAARAAGCTAVLVGLAEHDGGVDAVAPDLHFSDANALAERLGLLATGTEC